MTRVLLVIALLLSLGGIWAANIPITEKQWQEFKEKCAANGGRPVADLTPKGMYKHATCKEME